MQIERHKVKFIRIPLKGRFRSVERQMHYMKLPAFDRADEMAKARLMRSYPRDGIEVVECVCSPVRYLMLDSAE